MTLDSIMNKRPWTDAELKQLSTLVAGGATAFRAAAKFKRSIIACRNQARKMGMPFTHVRITRMSVRAKCEAAERTLRLV
jgi:hypothetical protein